MFHQIKAHGKIYITGWHLDSTGNQQFNSPLFGHDSLNLCAYVISGGARKAFQGTKLKYIYIYIHTHTFNLKNNTCARAHVYILYIKNVFNFDLIYDIFLRKYKYLYQVNINITVGMQFWCWHVSVFPYLIPFPHICVCVSQIKKDTQCCRVIPYR